MSIMAKTPSGYKKIGSAYLGERPVDKVFNANGDVVYALQRELTGVPPLLFKGKEQSELLNYRIYGDTVDGNGVGDLVESGEHTGEYKVPVTIEGKNLFNNIWEQGYIRADNGQKEASNIMICSDYFPVEYDKTYSISRTISEGYNNVRGYDASKNYIGAGTTVCSVNNPFPSANTKKGIFKITNSLVAFVKFNHYSNNLNMKYMIVEGDYTNTPMPPYEPYRKPVITNLYLPEPIKMVGDEAEYIDYTEQKQHRVRKNLWSGIVEQGSVSTTGAYADDIKRIRSKNVPLEPGTYTVSTNLLIRVIYACNDDNKIGVCIDAPMDTYSTSFTVPPGANNISIGMMKKVNGVAVDITPSDFEWGQIEKGSEVTAYEPYIENTELDVTLPALPTIKGTNTMSVDTEVQPSRMDIKGRIKTLA